LIEEGVERAKEHEASARTMKVAENVALVVKRVRIIRILFVETMSSLQIEES
jgi:hypothetical protein